LCHGLGRILTAGLIAVDGACVQGDEVEEEMEEPPSVKPPAGQLTKEKKKKKQKKAAVHPRRKVKKCFRSRRGIPILPDLPSKICCPKDT
jgi:hypothetical protein